MIKKLPFILITLFIFVVPTLGNSQSINLGNAINYALYTTGGAVTNTGIVYKTIVSGNIGSSVTQLYQVLVT